MNDAGPGQLRLEVEAHPALELSAFVTRFPEPLGSFRAPAIAALLRLDAEAPVGRDEEGRKAVRDLLRHGGYKPTGRGKPAAEYLVRAAGEGKLGSINAAVDACNAASLASGLPISVVDLDRTRAPLRVAIAEPGTRYAFNASGQEIDASGLLSLFDAEGASANAVKDAQRTKTGDATVRTLSLVWGCAPLAARVAATTEWYRGLLEAAGATTSTVPARPAT